MTDKENGWETHENHVGGMDERTRESHGGGDAKGVLMLVKFFA